MNRVITAFSMIAAIIAYSVFAVFVIRGETGELIAAVDEISERSENNDTAGAKAAADELSDQWYGFEKKMSVFVRDDKLNELSRTIAKISPYITDANDELDAELRNVRRQLWILYRSELPTWYNIF